MGKASKQRQADRRAARQQAPATGTSSATDDVASGRRAERVSDATTIQGRDRWGDTHALSRGADGQWHGTCRTLDERGHEVDMPFAVPEAVAREWQKNHAENRSMRATAASTTGARS